MEVISSSSIVTPNSSFSSNRRINRPYLPVKFKTARFKPVSAKKGESNSKGGPDFGNGSGLADENMNVLRKRIHELEAVENNCEPPSHWTEWEKLYHPNYGHDVCKFVGLLQILLMRARPGMAIGLAGLTATSLLALPVLVWIHLVETIKFGVQL